MLESEGAEVSGSRACGVWGKRALRVPEVLIRNHTFPAPREKASVMRSLIV